MPKNFQFSIYLIKWKDYMRKYAVVTVPDERLIKATQKVASFGNALKNQINIMTEALSHEGGIGIASNQLGFDNQVCIIEFNDPEDKNSFPRQVIINAEIAEKSEELATFDEGCLSVPKIELSTERSTSIKIRCQDQTGKRKKFLAKGLLARV